MITRQQYNKVQNLKSSGWKASRKFKAPATGKTQILMSKGQSLMVVNSHGHVTHAS